MFTFLSPLFLIGLVAAVIPLLIHLSRSRRTKKIQFSTTRFFTDQFLRSYRMSRLKELLLLACRMALCALLALALASPILLPPGASRPLGQSRSVALVIDNSASMGCQEDGQSMLDRAQGAARDVLDTLRPGDTASVVLAARRAAGPEVLFAEPTPQLGDVRQAIDTLKPSALGTDLTGAVVRAQALVRRSKAESKEIYVLSDLQDSGWVLPDEEPAGEARSEALVFFVRVRPTSPEDLAVTAVQYAAARPMVGVPFSLEAHIRNQSPSARPANVRLVVDGELVGERGVAQLQGGRWAVCRFHHTFQAGGWHEGYVEVQDESLEADNRRWFALDVVDSVRVLAVNGAPSRIARLDELFFLRSALAAAPEGGKQPSSIEVAEIAPGELAGQDLGKFRAVVMANVESVPPDGVERLEAFVDQGGSLFVFLGDRTNQSFYNQTFAAPTRLHGGLSPARLMEIERKPSGQQDVAAVGVVDFDHVALAAFEDPRFASLGGVGFQAVWGIDPGKSAVLMRADSGSPLLCEKPFGKGRVLLFASTADRDWTNFPVRAAYLPWIYRLVAYLAQEPLGRTGFYNTGDRVAVPVSAAEGMAQVLVRTPGKSVKHAAPGDDPAAPLVFADTYEPGVYTLYTPGKEEQGRRFAANLESFESDLTYLDDVLAERGAQGEFSSREAKIEAGFQELLGGSPLVAYVEDASRVNEASLSARRGLKLWDLVLLMALAVALVEPWLANRVSLRHYARPREIAPPRAGRPARTGRGRRVPPPPVLEEVHS